MTSNSNKVTKSGWPRKHKVTFVKTKPHVSTVQKVGHNEPCPCGSSKKFKRCCKTVDNIRPPEIEVIRATD